MTIFLYNQFKGDTVYVEFTIPCCWRRC